MCSLYRTPFRYFKIKLHIGVSHHIQNGIIQTIKSRLTASKSLCIALCLYIICQKWNMPCTNYCRMNHQKVNGWDTDNCPKVKCSVFFGASLFTNYDNVILEILIYITSRYYLIRLGLSHPFDAGCNHGTYLRQREQKHSHLQDLIR